jgi:hypothetical protein
MTKWDRSSFARPDEEAGVRWDDFVKAVSIYCFMNEDTISVRDAAEAFNTTDDVIREAVEDSYWASIVGPDDDPTKQIIQHDGD